MLKTLRIGEKILLQLRNAANNRRTFLSEAYRCQEAWDRRLDSGLLRKINLEEMYYELDQKFSRQGKASALDIDLFANAINNNSNIDELADLIHKLRLCPETTNTLPSTHHAVIRILLSTGRFQLLLDILNDRLNYGIFPDHFSYNLLIDTFIKKQDYASAARVAVLLMLQEDSEHPIANALVLYACHKYLENPDSWKAPEPEVDESKEEIKVRVKYLRNPYFDDHFDLREPSDLVGKTLAFYGKLLNNALGRTCQLRGLVLYKKYDAATALIKEWIGNEGKQVLFEEGLKIVRDEIDKIPEDKVTDEVKVLSTELSRLEGADLVKDSLEEALKNNIKVAVAKQEERDVSQQCQTYLDWETTRQKLLQEQLTELDRQKRLAQVDEMKKDLEERERILTFFDREDEIDLQIERKEIIRKKITLDKKKNSKVVDESYVPPEIIKRRRDYNR